MTMPVLFDTPRRRRSSLLSGLVYYWKLDEISGQRFDAVGGNTLSDPTSVTSVAGKQSLAANFVGTDADYLQGGTAFVPASTCSWAFWLRRTSSAVSMIIASKGVYGSDLSWVFQSYAGIGGITVWMPTSATDVGTIGRNATALYPQGVWVHSVVLFNGAGAANADRLKLHINGSATPTALTFSGTIPATIRASAGALHVGHVPGLTQILDAAVDEFGIWSRVLTTDEIARLYNSGNGLTYPFA